MVPSIAISSRPRQESVDRRTRKVRFFRNGDHFFAGLVVSIQAEKYRSLAPLMKDLTKVLDDKLFLAHGVRFILKMDGSVVTSLDEMADEESFICSSVETLKKLDYQSIKQRHQHLNVLSHNDPSKRRSMAEPRSSRAPAKSAGANVTTPKRVYVFLNGPKPRQLMRLLLDERSAQSFTHVLDEITKFFSPLPGPIRKIFDVELGECRALSDFFNGDIFVASVSGRITRGDCDLDLEEQKQLSKKRTVLKSGLSGRQAMTTSGTYVLSARDVAISVASPRVSRRMTLPKQMDGSCFNINHPPDIRDRYNIGKLIGNGNFATVHECVEWRTGRQAAIKIIERNRIKDKKLVGNEITILRRLRHPNIVNLLDEYTFAGRLYVVMELVKGGDLFSLLSQFNKFTEPEAADLVRSLCLALDYLHSNRVVHRDIKPENLLVTEQADGSKALKLADFGLASHVKEGEPLFTICGSPTYVAPEILAETGYGFKVDVWAAGVTAYILLCGFPPFQTDVEDQEALFSQILAGRFEFPSPYWDDVSIAGRDLIRKMIHVNVDSRLFAHQVLESDWMKSNCRLKPIREASISGSCSSDSGIQLKASAAASHAASRAPHAPPVSLLSPSAGGRQVKFRDDVAASRLVKTYSSSSTDLPTELSAGFWEDF
ncbi:Serine/threonine-protein kinase DCLK1 [Hypsibius exemplaris]|uniref:non-specific serine/threonine protein kinase n=1 Tax=Hypsibius exemplaris TaxID=2072580 RepID=A0A1W0X499_HYPEX|nr:Serine/threonine-protein kinase DCLK1 [Hypsibius exemplaris]